MIYLGYLGVTVLRQGGQSVCFLENNANYNANLALKAGKVTSESSGFIVRCSGKINLMEVMK